MVATGAGQAVDGIGIPDAPDLERMRRERSERLEAEVERNGLGGLVLLGTSAVSYATGAGMPGVDSARASIIRPVAVVVAGDPRPHLFTPYPDGAPPELPDDHLHPPLWTDLDDAVPEVARVIASLLEPGTKLGVDELPYPLARALDGFTVVSAAPALGAAKLRKTVDELACIRTAQHLNERAMTDVQPLLVPGVRQSDLSAALLGRALELGVSSNAIDPIWQVMPRSLAEGPWTTHGDVAFPTASTDRVLRDGDVVWVDSGMLFEGYASDFGRTWLVGAPGTPSERQQGQFARWRQVVDAVLEVTKPGATALALSRAAIAANGGTKPWIEHFYLSHGVGTDSAEMPLIGTDLGDSFDGRFVLAPGMVLVIEPVIWDDGAAGYRSEDIYAVTDDGWAILSDYPYDPFGA